MLAKAVARRGQILCEINPTRRRNGVTAAAHYCSEFLLLTSQHVWKYAVDLPPGADPEALQVAKDCLESIFGIDSSSTSEGVRPGLLHEIFTSLQANGQDPVSQPVSNTPSCSASPSSIQQDPNVCTTSNVCPLSFYKM
jgi:small glutamine-rich tetratricopeptide repeat-containing protein alpha